MKLQKVRIKNFKALTDVEVALTNFNVIVGPNGSGKSSILQSLHWMIQCARNPKVDTNRRDTDGSTLSLSNATYMPSPDYKNAGNEGVYGNFSGAKRMDVYLEADDGEGNASSAQLWLKAARNEGVSVHVPSNNTISTAIRDRTREFSAYIPGLAGIPLSEEKKSKSIVLRQAAAGDANTVLRNVLLLLQQIEDDVTENRPLSELADHLSRAVRRTNFQIRFDENRDYTITAEFKTKGMHDWRPLELAGIGFLQAIQIFAYIVFFNPRLLLIDEPDSHLHPDAQARLIREIALAAERHDCQVIMTTHSPNVMRALPDGSNVIWMSDGDLAGSGDKARQQMGWGLLDKQLVILTEDEDTALLRLLLSQWPDLERKIEVWPLNGCGNLPKGVVLSGLKDILGDVHLLVHRDGDMMLETEKQKWQQKWALEDHQAWVTHGADIESYFVKPDYCAQILDQSVSEFQRDVLDPLMSELTASDRHFVRKRTDGRSLADGQMSVPNDADAFEQLSSRGLGFVRKKALSKVRAKSESVYGGKETRLLGKFIPPGLELAPDLKSKIVSALSN